MEKTWPSTTLEHDRVVLKKHSIELAPLMFSYVDKDRKRLSQFLPWVEHTKTVEDEVSYIKMALNGWENHTLFDYGIYRKSDHQYLGNIGIHSPSWEHERCELGYWILGSFEGEGFVSEAVHALEKEAFRIGFHRIEIRCSSLNLKSSRVPQHCGYHLEACLFEDSIHRDQRRSTLVFSKLKPHGSESFRIIGFDFIYLFTENLSKSRDWYQKVLSTAPSIDIENFVEFPIGGTAKLCLHPADDKSPSTGGSVGYWRTSNFEETVKHFTQHGAKIYRGPLEIENNEKICQLLDPMGNVIGMIGR